MGFESPADFVAYQPAIIGWSIVLCIDTGKMP
jgi:hypothetical protein